MVRPVPSSQGKARTGRDYGHWDRHLNDKATPPGADILPANDVDEVWLGGDMCRGLRELATQQRSELVIS
jgi:hypothetical protein